MSEENKILVLVVDDQPSTQEILSINLDKLGYAVELANNGEEALEKVQKSNPAIILTDLQMPVMGGYETAVCLRERGITTPIIAVTGRSYDDEYNRCLKAGINDMLVKPFKRADIDNIIKKWLKTDDTTASVEETNTVSAAKNSVFDVTELLDTFMNNEETVISLLKRFIERTKGQLDNFPALTNAEDWENARKEAHMIKGAALTLAGSELGKEASLLEKASANAAKDEAEVSYQAVCEAFGRFTKEAEDFIKART